MGEKGTQLNKCLCKAHVCGVIMVTVLLISERDDEPNVCSLIGLYVEMVSSALFLQSYCNDVVTEFCSSVCVFHDKVLSLLLGKPNAELCWYRKAQVGATVTVCTNNSNT